MHAGRWDRSSLLGSEIKGRTLGIIGLGRIGGEVAIRARAFGMEVIAYDPYIAQTRFETLRVQSIASLEALLEQSNIVTVHTPLTDETTGMIGKREIARLPQQAIVVNMSTVAACISILWRWTHSHGGIKHPALRRCLCSTQWKRS